MAKTYLANIRAGQKFVYCERTYEAGDSARSSGYSSTYTDGSPKSTNRITIVCSDGYRLMVDNWNPQVDLV
jgi:hypothetical protein